MQPPAPPCAFAAAAASAHQHHQYQHHPPAANPPPPPSPSASASRRCASQVLSRPWRYRPMLYPCRSAASPVAAHLPQHRAEKHNVPRVRPEKRVKRRVNGGERKQRLSYNGRRRRATSRHRLVNILGLRFLSAGHNRHCKQSTMLFSRDPHPEICQEVEADSVVSLLEGHGRATRHLPQLPHCTGRYTYIHICHLAHQVADNGAVAVALHRPGSSQRRREGRTRAKGGPTPRHFKAPNLRAVRHSSRPRGAQYAPRRAYP